jgi:hypothetical protein
MTVSEQAVTYRIWAVDNVVYGPVDLSTLIDWARDERVTSDTWVFTDTEPGWRRAGEIVSLATAVDWSSRSTEMPDGGRVATQPTAAMSLKPGTLRRIKIFGTFSDEQLGHFLDFMEVIKVRQFTELVRAGSPGDAMYLVLEGELRVRLQIDNTETILATMGTGEFFGEIALFDHGPRSADVVANQDSTLLKIGVAAVQKLMQEKPDIAAPFLWAIGKTLAARIRQDNKRHQTSMIMARAVRAGNAG